MDYIISLSLRKHLRSVKNYYDHLTRTLVDAMLHLLRIINEIVPQVEFSCIKGSIMYFEDSTPLDTAYVASNLSR